MSIKISRILHAGYLLECGGTHIAFDTIFENPFSRNCYAFPSVKFDQFAIQKLKLSAVFISHFHDDHCSLESLDLLDRATPIYLYCVFEELHQMIRQLGFKQVHALQIDIPVCIGEFEVIPRRALDVDVDSLFHIKAQGLNILNVVDSWIDYETLDQLAQYKWDMILWPFQTMREIEVLSPNRFEPASGEIPIEWVDQLKKLNPRYLVSSSCQFVQESWSWYNQALFPISYKSFQMQMRDIIPQTQIVRFNPSHSVILDQDSLQESEPLTWILPLGIQDVDYDYQKNLQAPPTSQIAQHFTPLLENQLQEVYSYCEEGLLKKYSELENTEEEYFQKPRLWRLSIYDHKGLEKDFYYLIDQKEIQLTEQREPLAWMTEVPIAKLYAALNTGESLTSMYMRINNDMFDSDIEKEIQSVDLMLDPLIRCLFDQGFGEYQKQQLKKIKNKELI